jgi:hypothetical protein
MKGFHKPRRGTPIVNHEHFTDARPTLGSSSATFNPGAKAGPLPNGPQKFPPGESRVQKNVARGLTNTKAPY